MDSVVELVIENMHRLPELIPTGFRCSYTPIAAAGTDAQITQTARLLASQMTSAGLGIGAVTKGIQGNQVSIYPVQVVVHFIVPSDGRISSCIRKT